MFVPFRFALILATAAFACGCQVESSVDVSSSVAESSSTANTAGPGLAPPASAEATGQTSARTEAASGETGTAPVETKGTIAFSALTLTNPFFTVIADNLQDEAAKHGFEVIVDNADRDVKRQAEQIDSYITRGVSAIVINPCDRRSIGPAIKKANEAGIPVFTCDLQCVAEDAEIAGHVGTDNFQGGKLAGKAMIEALGEDGGKVLILHFEQANSCVLRVDGFLEVINAYNEDRETGKIEIVAKLEGGGLRDEGFAATSGILASEPDLDGIFAINDPSALGAYAALEQAGKQDQVQIVAFDGQIDGKQAIKQGKIYADPIQFPDNMGRIVVQKIVKYLNGEEYEEVTLIPTELYTKADAEKDTALD